jgi:molybdate transport repressor ModE-like protein
MNIVLQFNWVVTKEREHHSLDRALFELLEHVDRLGSLKKAAEHVAVSYRFAWGLMAKWEQLLGHPLVVLERGRGAYLSPLGEKLLHGHYQLNAAFGPELDNFSTQFRSKFNALLQKNLAQRLRIYASHGIAINHLRECLADQLDIHFQGSLECLQALQQGECDIAGFHIPEGDAGQAMQAAYLDYLDPDTHALLYIVKRRQGFIVENGNPKNIHRLDDLLSANIRFINRQPNSGTRLLFDHLLEEQVLSPADINGYETEEFTHMAVAAMVASRVADVGFGIEPAAEVLNLSFVPLIWEHYCLAIPHTLMHSVQVNNIMTQLKAASFRSKLKPYSGYQTTHAGEQVNFSDVFSHYSATQ